LLETQLRYGVFVTYTDEIKEAYLEVLEDLYDRGLKWAYEPSKGLNLPEDKIRAVIGSKKYKGLKLKYDDFLTAFFVLPKLSVDRDEHTCLPIPPCNQLLPYNHSFWNAVKGGSDTITKLFWNCLIVPTCPAPQSTVIGRMLQIFAVVVHHTNHLSTAKDNLDFYASMAHYRNCRNWSWPFWRTLDELVE
jgi:hypothetical protein